MENSFQGEYDGEVAALYNLSSFEPLVPCTDTDHIYHLWLYNNNLEGQLPPEVYIMLTSLHSTHLDTNKGLEGSSISPEIGRLTDLNVLSLWSSGLVEPFLLKELGLSGNNLQGTLPSELGLLPHLAYLPLDTNYISGSIPSEVGLMTSLVWMFLSTNRVHGTVPTELGILANLEQLELIGNFLTGTIPTELGFMESLDSLPLSLNFLTGKLPSQLAQLSVSRLCIYDNSLTGTLSTELGKLQNVVLLWLYGNELSGATPSETGHFKKLQQLRMESNLFSGEIPSQIGLLGNLDLAILRDNKLSGQLPSTVGLLEKLEVLVLTLNQLTGKIPSALEQLAASLDLLQIQGNVFSGVIPNKVRHLGNETEGQSCAFFDCGLFFDCSKTFCDCECPCFDNATSTNGMNSDVFGAT